MRATCADVRLLHCGDTALIIEFGDRIERGLSDRVLALAHGLERTGLPGVVEIVPAFRSLAIHYDPTRIGATGLATQIRAVLDSPEIGGAVARLLTLPACYAPAFAPDLDDVAAAAGLSREDVIARHSDATYHAYMIGFLPGFAYLGDLDPALHLPRRPTPRRQVAAGSIAIATGLTAVYPVASPGGWHLIGRTPVRMFDPRAPVPSLIRPGDRVRFSPVSADAYARLAALCARGRYHPPIEAAPP